MKIKRVLPLFTLSLFTANIYCMNRFVLKKSTAVLATGLSTAAVGGSYLAYKYKNDKYIDFNWQEWQKMGSYTKQEFKKMLTLTAVTGITTGALFFRRTPKAFLMKAVRKINKRDMALFKEIKNKTPDELRKNISEHYVQNQLPVVQAFNDLNILLQDSNKIVDCLNIAKTSSNDPKTIINATQLLKEFDNEYFRTIINGMLFIKNEPDFLKQYKAEQLKKAAQAAEDNAHANQMNAIANTMNAIRPHH